MSEKLSVRNRTKGAITSLKREGVLASVEIKLAGSGDIVTSVVTLDAVDDMQIKVGDQVLAS